MLWFVKYLKIDLIDLYEIGARSTRFELRATVAQR